MHTHTKEWGRLCDTLMCVAGGSFPVVCLSVCFGSERRRVG